MSTPRQDQPHPARSSAPFSPSVLKAVVKLMDTWATPLPLTVTGIRYGQAVSHQASPALACARGGAGQERSSSRRAQDARAAPAAAASRPG